jgi:hypothetical protein
MNVRLLIVTIAVAGFDTTGGAPQLSPADRAAVDAYRSAISAAMREALMRRRNGHNVLESLPDDEFQRLRRELPGAMLNREEVVSVEPDPDYFTKLAAARGDGADRAFFSALKATYPESAWPIYLHRQTDYGGCSRFGSMTLIGTYRAWLDFQRRFPDRYAAGAKKEADGVIEHLTTSTCACGDLASVRNELERFVQSFPRSAARGRVGQRLEGLRAGRSDIRPGCQAR